MKKRLLITLIVFSLIVTVGLTAIALRTRKLVDTNIYIFANIQECNALDATGKFTPYTDASQDTHVENLPYTAFLAGEYHDGDVAFQIFAYEFESLDTARAYFDDITGKDSSTLSRNFSLSEGMRNARIVVFSENHAYVAYFSNDSTQEVLEILKDIFSTKIN